MKRLSLWVVTLLLVASLIFGHGSVLASPVVFGAEEFSEEAAFKAKAAKIALDNTKLTLSIKETFTLKPSFADGVANRKVTWSSDNKSIVKVDSKGKVTALKKGTAIITAKLVSGETATCKITVTTKPAIKSIKLNKKTATLFVTGTLALKATVSPSKADQTVTWSSSDTKVAKVDSKGKVTAVKAGTATITVRASNAKTATCKVTVKAKPVPKSITLSKTKATLHNGETLKLQATITPANADQTVKWLTSDNEEAEVTPDGVVIWNINSESGRETITAKTSNGLTATCVVTFKRQAYKKLPRADLALYVDKKLVKLPKTYDALKKAVPGGKTTMEDEYEPIIYKTKYFTAEFEDSEEVVRYLEFIAKAPVKTYRGLQIGDTLSKMQKLYGKPHEIYMDEDYKLTIYLYCISYTKDSHYGLVIEVNNKTKKVIAIHLASDIMDYA